MLRNAIILLAFNIFLHMPPCGEINTFSHWNGWGLKSVFVHLSVCEEKKQHNYVRPLLLVKTKALYVVWYWLRSKR